MNVIFEYNLLQMDFELHLFVNITLFGVILIVPI